MRKLAVIRIFSALAIIGGSHALEATAAGWTKVASEYKPFTFNRVSIVRFGSGTSWAIKFVAAGQCSAAFFGSDPAVGKTKECDTWVPVAAVTPTSYTVKLSWAIPSARQNGGPLALSEISGYEVYYANASNNTNDTVVPIHGGSVSSFVLSQLPAGTYYFAIASIDTKGLKSPLSGVVTAHVGP